MSFEGIDNIDFEEVKKINAEKDLEKGIIWNRPPQKYLEILQDKDLFQKICNEFTKKIEGEEASCKVLFLCAGGGRLVKNCQIASYNILVNDEAGAGKDYVTGKVLEILPKTAYIHKTRISPTVFTYWHNAEKEPEWTWDGKVFYPEDISETVLNSDVFKVMSSSGSTATIVIRQRAVDLEIVGKPVMITTTATATPNPELTRRFVILNLDSSENQTHKIKRRHSKFAESGLVPEYNHEYTSALSFMKIVSVKIPFASKIDQYFPDKSLIMRTHYPRFLDYVRASCAFHQFQRQIDPEGYLIAEGQDYDLARECFLKLTSNKFMIPLTINQKKIIAVFEQQPKLKGSASQLHDNHMNFITLANLQTNLDRLVSYGLLQTFAGKDSLNRDITFYCLEGSYNPSESINLPTYEELCRITEVSKPSIITEVTKPSIITRDTFDTFDTSATYDIAHKPQFTQEEIDQAGLTPEEVQELNIEIEKV